VPYEDHDGQAHARENERIETSFDDLARGLASGAISRGRALRLAGAALVSAALGGLLGEEALAVTAKAGCAEARAGEGAYARAGCDEGGDGSRRDRFTRRCRRRRGTVCRTPEGRRCVNTDRNEDHCGECGNRCGANETCVDGRCVRRSESVCVSKRYCNDRFICC